MLAGIVGCYGCVYPMGDGSFASSRGPGHRRGVPGGPFPHLDVTDNIAFGPRSRGSRRRATARAADVLARVTRRTPARETRDPVRRGAGIGPARALAAEPHLLLLDGCSPRSTSRHAGLTLLRGRSPPRGPCVSSPRPGGRAHARGPHRDPRGGRLISRHRRQIRPPPPAAADRSANMFRGSFPHRPRRRVAAGRSRRRITVAWRRTSRTRWRTS
jgi:hypothetical protein